jgi:hypothetical protein
VVVARQAMFTCSDATQAEIEADITAQHLDGLVVASCSPKLHELTFRGVAQRGDDRRPAGGAMNRDAREVIREEPLVRGRLLGLLGDRRRVTCWPPRA